jgi:hemerythrin-like domain-containing protein
MLTIGPLMIEHRLIEKGIEILRQESKRIADEGKVNLRLIDALADFVRTYADRTHHGKEEDILFRSLAQKDLSAEDLRTMQGLVGEHAHARTMVAELVEAKERCLSGEKRAVATTGEKMADLARFYPEHIRKEDRVFFPASLKYFNRQEQDAMLEEMREFDRRMIHEKYTALIQQLERRER